MGLMFLLFGTNFTKKNEVFLKLHCTDVIYIHYYCHFCRSTILVDLHLALSLPFSVAKRSLSFPTIGNLYWKKALVFS